MNATHMRIQSLVNYESTQADKIMRCLPTPNKPYLVGSFQLVLTLHDLSYSVFTSVKINT